MTSARSGFWIARDTWKRTFAGVSGCHHLRETPRNICKNSREIPEFCEACLEYEAASEDQRSIH